FHFKGVCGKTPQNDDEVVTGQMKQILNIKCTIVRNTVSERNRSIERTFDFYAQDKQNNVWYMNENAFEQKHKRFAKTNDSWQTKIDSAKPGIIMPADPRPGDNYRQKYY